MDGLLFPLEVHDPLLTPEETAARLGVSRAMLTRWIKAGKFPPAQVVKIKQVITVERLQPVHRHLASTVAQYLAVRDATPLPAAAAA